MLLLLPLPLPCASISARLLRIALEKRGSGSIFSERAIVDCQPCLPYLVLLFPRPLFTAIVRGHAHPKHAAFCFPLGPSCPLSTASWLYLPDLCSISSFFPIFSVSFRRSDSIASFFFPLSAFLFLRSVSVLHRDFTILYSPDLHPAFSRFPSPCSVLRAPCSELRAPRRHLHSSSANRCEIVVPPNQLHAIITIPCLCIFFFLLHSLWPFCFCSFLNLSR
jgi:hypothetical protein